MPNNWRWWLHCAAFRRIRPLSAWQRLEADSGRGAAAQYGLTTHPLREAGCAAPVATATARDLRGRVRTVRSAPGSSQDTNALSSRRDRPRRGRTHWALKQVDLFQELARKGIILPPDLTGLPPQPIVPQRVDVSTHVFDVAFSFPGGRRSKLLVVFIGSDYQNETWPNIEWRAIREVLNAREHARIMYVRLDHGQVDGVLQQDGYIDATRFTSGATRNARACALIGCAITLAA